MRTRKIELSQERCALVDAEDYLWLNAWRWNAKPNRGATFYAARSRRAGEMGPSTIYMHRAILCPTDGMQVDHINHNTLDNRRANLRLCTWLENKRNTRARAANKSGYVGVHWKKQMRRWAGGIRVEGRGIFLGYFDDPVEAAKAYDAAAIKYHGEFASLNFPQAAHADDDLSKLTTQQKPTEEAMEEA